jgi:MoaA/NifB/PqqE/SkfB family radical SAM enzyme
MNALSQSLWQVCAPVARGWPAARKAMRAIQAGIHVAHHTAAARVPALIRPHTVNLTVAVTASCNQRCTGCLYERGFMAKQQLPLRVMELMVEDAAALKIRSLRLYGGEPLLHKDLPAVVEKAVDLGLRTYVTTNGVLLAERIDELHAAGLRDVTFGYYGSGKDYDYYVARRGNYERMERGIATVREKHGDQFGIRMNWLLMRPTCSLESLEEAWRFAMRYRTPMQVDLIHYSLPYFSEGPERALQFTDADRPAIERVVRRLLELKREQPGMIENTEMGLRSIPDWLLLGPAMRVPCDKYRMVWVGADGTVQMCYVTFVFGNLHQNRLRELLYTPEHEDAAKAAFALQCPNCHCGFDERVRKHLPSRIKFGSPGPLDP